MRFWDHIFDVALVDEKGPEAVVKVTNVSVGQSKLFHYMDTSAYQRGGKLDLDALKVQRVILDALHTEWEGHHAPHA